MADRKETVIALLGQPNSGKSTLFNALTGLRQRVGNWPGKTVEKRDGSFTHNGRDYLVVDLPGSYSLSANSDEEVITRDFIVSGNADVVCILAGSSQLERSLYMLADYAGIEVPCFLVLNMKDVAEEQGKKIDPKVIEEKLGIPVILFSAPDTKNYDIFYDALIRAVDQKTCLMAPNLIEKIKPIEGEDDNQRVIRVGEAKFAWIDSLLDGAVTSKPQSVSLSKLDRIYTHPVWGKPAVVGTIILGLLASFIPALPLMGIGSLIGALPAPLEVALVNNGCPAFIAAVLTDVLLRGVGFIVQMLGFVFGVTLIFGLLEEVGVMARISYVFDNTMAKLGLQGKSVMPFLVSFGCTMGGAAGARVIDNWGQKVLTIALAWAVPCGAAWAIIPMLSTVFFGAWMPVVIIAILYKVGHVIEPVTKLFGMSWQTFMAFIASSLGKEGAIGVLTTIFTGSGGLSISTLMGGAGRPENLNEILTSNIAKPEALALIFAMTFNMPCIVALAATYQETHSAKWTARIAIYYTVTALVIAGIAYRIGLLIW